MAGRSAQDVVRDAVRYCAFVHKQAAEKAAEKSAEEQAGTDTNRPQSDSTVAEMTQADGKDAQSSIPDQDHTSSQDKRLPSGLRWRQALFSADTMLCVEMTLGADDDFRIQALGRGAKRLLPNATPCATSAGHSLVQYVHPADISKLRACAHQLEQRCKATPASKVATSDTASIRLASFEGGSAGVIAGGTTRKYVAVEMHLTCRGVQENTCEAGKKRTRDGQEAVHDMATAEVLCIKQEEDFLPSLRQGITEFPDVRRHRRIVLIASFDKANMHTHMHASTAWSLDNCLSLPVPPQSFPTLQCSSRYPSSPRRLF